MAISDCGQTPLSGPSTPAQAEVTLLALVGFRKCVFNDSHAKFRLER